MFEPDPQSVDRVAGWLDQFLDAIDLRRPGREGSWGEDIAWAIIWGPDLGAQGGIVGRCAEGVQPDGAPWPENSDNPAGQGYRSRKLREYGWDETNRRTGDMLSAEKLYGQTEIGHQEVTLKYGVGEAPTASYAPTGHASITEGGVSASPGAPFRFSGRDVGAGRDPRRVVSCEGAARRVFLFEIKEPALR